MKSGVKPEWFGGNMEAVKMYEAFVDLLHGWDDLIDKDKVVTDHHINHLFLTALVYLPSNPFYKSIQDSILPMWITIVSAYETANHFEKTKDPHGLEISHTLRYAAGHIIAFAIHVCVGPVKAKEFLPEMWKSVVCERFDDYRKEHLNADS